VAYGKKRQIMRNVASVAEFIESVTQSVFLTSAVAVEVPVIDVRLRDAMRK
jgi:hypothetical protein